MLKPAIAAALLVAAAAAHAAGEASVFVVPAREPVADRTQQAWSARWWQWAASFERSASPVADLTGEKCAAGQEGEVFFLAGTYARHPVERRCTVPSGKHLFFPLVNYIVMPDGGGPSGCADVIAVARGMTDEPLALFAEVDGRPVPSLEQHRQATKDCFNMAARRQGVPAMPAASNGYWLMLKPLPKGTHRLRIGGALPSLRQDITYVLLVE